MSRALDDLDRKILNILMHDAGVSYTEIGKKLFVAAGTVHVRIKKLRKRGVIRGSQLIVDPEKLGFDVTAFLGIYLDKSSLFESVERQLIEIPEITAAYYTTGVYGIFAKIVCRDTNHLRSVLHDKIQKIPGIQRTETFISLQASIERPLDLGVEEG